MEKFLQIHLLISIIFSICLVVFGREKTFLSLNSSYIMEARERFMSIDLTKLPDPPRPSYTFTLFSRDLFEKSNFKDYDSLLENKLSRTRARVSDLASILDNGNSSKSADVKAPAPRRTSTHYVGPGEYVASFTIGTEQTRTYLIIDTGSDLVWWQCGPCAEGGCYRQNDPLYVSTSSRTYETLDCIAKSERCFQSDRIICWQSTRACLYDVIYADGSRTRGWIAEDTITFVLDHNQERILFGCGKDQRGEPGGLSFSPRYSGIAGIGRRVLSGGYSLPSQFKADIMAICLPGIDPQGSILSFHTTPFEKTISAQLLPNPTNLYYVNLFKVFVNDKEITLNPSIGNSRNAIDRCLVDTGTAVTYFPRDFYNEFRNTFRQEVKDHPLVTGPRPAGFDTCYTGDAVVVPDFPQVTMYFGRQDPENLLSLTHQRVMVYIRGMYCLAFFASDTNFAILGGTQLQGIGLTFDTAENTLSFDLDQCN
ncbi:hypothetical protein P3S68_032543 [Capsicum galapagoense]